MEFTKKPQRRGRFEMSLPLSDTIMDVKKKIEYVEGKDVYPYNEQILVLNGKILEDETTLAENNLSEDSVIEVMRCEILPSLIPMKLSVKAVKGRRFVIWVRPIDTVVDVKKNIECTLGKDSYPCGDLMLIHNGRVLKDKTTLAEIEVPKDGFLYVMRNKIAPKLLTKLTVKTLKGRHFKIRVLSDDTVMDVKKKIENILGKDNYPCGEQLLIYHGKAWKDNEATLAQSNVLEDGLLVVMHCKTFPSTMSTCSK